MKGFLKNILEETMSLFNLHLKFASFITEPSERRALLHRINKIS